MLLNQKKFYQDIAHYYEHDSYDGLKEYLESREKEMKQLVMPDPGCVVCGGGDVDEDGIAAVTKSWIQERNHAIAIITYEQARLFEQWEKWGESINKYKDAQKMMERNGMTNLSMYDASIESIKEIEGNKG